MIWLVEYKRKFHISVKWKPLTDTAELSWRRTNQHKKDCELRDGDTFEYRISQYVPQR